MFILLDFHGWRRRVLVDMGVIKSGFYKYFCFPPPELITENEINPLAESVSFYLFIDSGKKQNNVMIFEYEGN